MNNHKTIITVVALIGIAARYHMKELKRMHTLAFEAGWEHGRNFQRENPDAE